MVVPQIRRVLYSARYVSASLWRLASRPHGTSRPTLRSCCLCHTRVISPEFSTVTQEPRDSEFECWLVLQRCSRKRGSMVRSEKERSYRLRQSFPLSSFSTKRPTS